MIYGDGSRWLPHFRSLAERLAPYFVTMVPACAQVLGPRAKEDEITRGLVDRLMKNAEVRAFAFVQDQFHPYRTDDDGRVDSLGQIDFVVSAGCGWPRDVYLAYECKRLNVVADTGQKYLATEYVKQGVWRFVTEQYSEGLPFACMLGYVLDGRVCVAKRKVQGAIRRNAVMVSLVGTPESVRGPQRSIQFTTVHSRARSGTAIVLRHALVSCI